MSNSKSTSKSNGMSNSLRLERFASEAPKKNQFHNFWGQTFVERKTFALSGEGLTKPLKHLDRKLNGRQTGTRNQLMLKFYLKRN